MRLPLILILPVLLFGALLDVYICRAVWARCRRHASLWRRVALWSSVLLPAIIVAVVAWPKKTGGDGGLAVLMWILYSYLSIYVPKTVFVLVDLLASIPRLWKRRRVKCVTRAAWLCSLAVFGLMWWGALVNRFRIDVNEVEIVRSDLPAAFDGFTIAQISDLHVGSYGADTAYVGKVVRAVNALNPDLIVFTGDIVNRRTSELQPFVKVLSGLDATEGVCSVLGNHDYGDYFQWLSPAEKAENMAMMYGMQSRMRWNLLDNATRYIVRGADSLAVVGVGNVGDPPFHTYGNLSEAYPGDPADGMFKILLSHNPAHWDNDICDSPDKNIALTLSGHTHAMQMEIAGLSPAAMRYGRWGGLYADADSAHLLYVNIGIGEVGIPARIGATPEITLFTLRDGNNR